MSERLNKVLAQHGVGSRREVERWIVEGRLQLNGVLAKLGDRFNEGDRVLLDGKDVGKRLMSNAVAQVLAYHKPQGQLIERDERVTESEFAADTGETVMERLPKQRGVRWVPVNPMHAGDSGLLLFTSDGNLSYALTRHKKKIPAVYMVRVHLRGGVEAAPKLPLSLSLDNQTVAFTEVEASAGEGDNVWYKVSMARADKRAAVRALFVSHDLTISRMMQVAFAGIELTKEMPRSRHYFLKPAQVESLYQVAELPPPAKAVTQRQRLAELDVEEEKYKPRPGKRERLRQRDEAKRPAVSKTTSKAAPAKRAAGSVSRVTRSSRTASGTDRPARADYSRK